MCEKAASNEATQLGSQGRKSCQCHHFPIGDCHHKVWSHEACVNFKRSFST